MYNHFPPQTELSCWWNYAQPWPIKSCLQGLCYGEKLSRRWELAHLDNEPQISQVLLSGGGNNCFCSYSLFKSKWHHSSTYSWETYFIIIFFKSGFCFWFHLSCYFFSLAKSILEITEESILVWGGRGGGILFCYLASTEFPALSFSQAIPIKKIM